MTGLYLVNLVADGSRWRNTINLSQCFFASSNVYMYPGCNRSKFPAVNPSLYFLQFMILLYITKCIIQLLWLYHIVCLYGNLIARKLTYFISSLLYLMLLPSKKLIIDCLFLKFFVNFFPDAVYSMLYL